MPNGGCAKNMRAIGKVVKIGRIYIGTAMNNLITGECSCGSVTFEANESKQVILN